MVSVDGKVFSCKAWPFSAHCGQAGYEPLSSPDNRGNGAWRDAWTLAGWCSGSIGPTSSPSVDPANLVGACPKEWSGGSNVKYEEGDMVSITVSNVPLRKVAYKCKVSLFRLISESFNRISFDWIGDLTSFPPPHSSHFRPGPTLDTVDNTLPRTCSEVPLAGPSPVRVMDPSDPHPPHPSAPSILFPVPRRAVPSITTSTSATTRKVIPYHTPSRPYPNARLYWSAAGGPTPGTATRPGSPPARPTRAWRGLRRDTAMVPSPPRRLRPPPGRQTYLLLGPPLKPHRVQRTKWSVNSVFISSLVLVVFVLSPPSSVCFSLTLSVSQPTL